MKDLRKILIIEDDYESSKLLKDNLKFNFDPFVVSSEVQAWDFLEKNQISIILINEEFTKHGIFLEKIIIFLETQSIPVVIFQVNTRLQKIAMFVLKEINHLVNGKNLCNDFQNIENFCKEIKLLNPENTKIIDTIEKKSLKILLAENYPHSQIFCGRLLKKDGFHDVHLAENGEEALKLAQEEHFELMIIDMQMPVMNGFEMIEKIRELPEYKNIPIIALTAFARRDDRERCIAVGADCCLSKPVDPGEFIGKVNFYYDCLI